MKTQISLLNGIYLSPELDCTFNLAHDHALARAFNSEQEQEQV